MKSIQICAIILVLALNSIKADKDMVRKACEAEVHVTEAEVDKFFENPTTINDSVKCYLKCVMEKGGVMKDGHLIVDAFLKSLETYPAYKNRKAEVIKAGEDCKQQVGVNDCDMAFKVFKCLVEHPAKVFEEN